MVGGSDCLALRCIEGLNFALRVTGYCASLGIACFVFSALSISTAANEIQTMSDATIQLVVFTPRDDTEKESIYCSMSVDGWPAGGRPIERIAPGIYSSNVKFSTSTDVEYKFLREQDWQTVERGSTGQEIRNRRLSVDSSAKALTVVHTVDSWADVTPRDDYRVVFPSPQETPAETHTGEIRAHRQIHSATLDNRRDVFVWLPPGYDADTERRYPVLYMLDGQNVFNEATSFKGQEWGADETATRLVERGEIEPLIIVAVNHSPNREAEHIPLFDKPENSLVDEYLKFLTNQIKPMIDQEYRTRTEPEYNVLIGASYGGLFSLYAACHAGDHFGGYAVISPSLQIEKGRIVEHVAEHAPSTKARLWIELSAGNALERTLSSFGGQLATARRLRDVLRTTGFVAKDSLHYSEIDGEFHDEHAWAGRMEPLLEHFFPADESEN